MGLLMSMLKYMAYSAGIVSFLICLYAGVRVYIDEREDKEMRVKIGKAKADYAHEQEVLNTVFNLTDQPIKNVRELATDAHKRIDDTRRHFGKDIVALATTARSVDALIFQSLDTVSERLTILEDVILKKERKNAKSAKS